MLFRSEGNLRPAAAQADYGGTDHADRQRLLRPDAERPDRPDPETGDHRSAADRHVPDPGDDRNEPAADRQRIRRTGPHHGDAQLQDSGSEHDREHRYQSGGGGH